MTTQVIVKHGDRVWDSIKPSGDTAMYRVTEHMKKDRDPQVARIADLVQWKLIFGKGTDEGKRVFEEHGFTVEIRMVSTPDPTI